MENTLIKIYEILNARKQGDPKKSYVAQLYQKGLNKILQKVGEEATETILAAKDFKNDNSPTRSQELVHETADLWFHSLVLLSYLNIPVTDIINELNQRMGISGLQEKANRTPPK